ncbi:hypothetical protein SNOG_12794 [Parastagonospora nodorum SN15]|uniref:ZZ-type domain-containing protein n=1 Tax=Phaeosphaeria nodorum (strain SN15 / ATCC MYA-4574 / FGSC 10173) TaxID=321614 RepID=Q0U620_PHANO|nr:hypothetical protein SNOG_12794 [Parastagonospora nodorum SN15]EAT79594.2 hypothetical protein SNOG_12794 [Parastagonospora nodorum SN15]
MVRLPGVYCYIDTPVYLPFVSRLDNYVRLNPERGKSDEEKAADRIKYKPGENVLPKLRRREERSEDDERMLAEVQALSLREVGIPSGSGSSNNALGPPRDRRRRERSRDQSRDSRRSRDGRRSRSRQSPGTSPTRVILPPRAIEHQSSLRSLLSSSEIDSEEVDEDLVRQVLEELVSEGVDLSQIGPSQEEEITERIAEAVRRRHASGERGESAWREKAWPAHPQPLCLHRCEVRWQGKRMLHVGDRMADQKVAPQPHKPLLVRRYHDQDSLMLLIATATVLHDNHALPVKGALARRGDWNDRLPFLFQLDRATMTLSDLRLQTHQQRLAALHHVVGSLTKASDLEWKPDSNSVTAFRPPHRQAPVRLENTSCTITAHIAMMGPLICVIVAIELAKDANTESLTPPHVLMSEDDPKDRLEDGVFCDSCKSFAIACYWKCDYCNEGDWGFCNECVNQGKHCTHPLLPLAHQPRSTNNMSTPSTPRLESGLFPPEIEVTANTPPRTPKAASFIRGPDYATIANLVFRPLNFTTLCNICRYSIPPSNTRYHCLKCNAGDYDICMACYHKLNVSGRIAKEDGINGWRKCLRGHRMVVIGFEDRDGGQQRMVVRDLVGGYTLKEDADDTARSPTSGKPMREWKWRDYEGNVHNYRAPLNAAVPAQKFPPDGGVGLRLKAKWSYWPDEGVKDELAFPRHAEIREAVAINKDWYWGVYCGGTGLLPASFVAGV